MSKKRENKISNTAKKLKGGIEWWLYLPIIIALGYVPMIMHTHRYYRESLDAATWFNGNAAIDFSLAYKSFLIIFCAVFSLLFLLVSLYKYPVKRDKIFIPGLVYAGFVLLSGIFSQWKDLAFKGSFEMFESVLVILSYIMIAFFAIYLISHDGERGIRIIMRGALPGLFFVMLIGFFQYFGANLIATEFAESFIVGSDVSTNTGFMKTNSGTGIITATLYNSNYLGTFYSVITPVFLFLGISTRIKYEKIVLFIATFLGLFNLYGSHSAAGLFTLGFIVLISILFLGYKIGKTAGIIFTVIVAFVCVLGAVLSFTWEPVKNRVWSEFGLGEEDGTYLINSITTDENGITYYYDGNYINFTYDVFGDKQINLKVKDKNGKILKTTPNDAFTQYQVEVPGFENPFFVSEKILGEKDVTIVISGANLTFSFYKSNSWNGAYNYSYVSRSKDAIPFPETPAKANVFPDSFMGRGGMWNVTIPTLKDHMIIGSGANTFIMVYPQVDDLVLSGGDLDAKPHSLYLQQWSDNGFIAMVAYIVLFIWAIVRGIRRFYGDTPSGAGTSGDTPSGATHHLPLRGRTDWISLGFILGIAANLIAGIANDSMVVTGALVWTVLGMGIGWFKYGEGDIK